MDAFFLHITDVQYLGEYRLALRFTNGAEREIDLSDELDGEMFEPLRDPSKFAEAYVDQETRTVTWPNGADLAPEFLFERSRAVTPADSR